MLYYIDKSCVESLNNGDSDAAEFLEQLILHRKKCKNLIVAERNVLRELSNSWNLSPIARSLYKILANRCSEFKLILSHSKKYYKVVSSYQGNKMVHSNNQIIIHLSMKEGNCTDFTDRSILLAESTDDINFYKIVGNYYIKHQNIHRMGISFEEMIGGGDTTSTRLEQIIKEERRLCLCIIDSDKKYKDADYGDTLRKALNIVNKNNTENIELYPLPTHEIENLIPVEILCEVCKNIPESKTGIDFLKFLLKRDSSEYSPVFYFDYKKGLPKNKFILKTNSTKEDLKKFRRLDHFRQYWTEYINAFGATIESDTNEPIIPGVCEKILSHAIKYLKDQPQLEKVIANSYIQNLWLNLGSAVVTWGCVGNRIAA